MKKWALKAWHSSVKDDRCPLGEQCNLCMVNPLAEDISLQNLLGIGGSY